MAVELYCPAHIKSQTAYLYIHIITPLARFLPHTALYYCMLVVVLILCHYLYIPLTLSLLLLHMYTTPYTHTHAGSGEVNRAYYKADVAGALYEVLVQFGASALICEKAFQVGVYTSVYVCKSLYSILLCALACTILI